MALEEYHQGKQGKYVNKYKISKIEKFNIEPGITLLKATCLLLLPPFIKQTEQNSEHTTEKNVTKKSTRSNNSICTQHKSIYSIVCEQD